MRQDLAKLMVERPRGGERIRIYRAKPNQKRRKPVEGAPDVRLVGPDMQVRRIEDVWYAFALRCVPSCVAGRRGISDCFFKVALRDLLNSDSGRKRLVDAYGSPDVYAGAKRQLGKKELLRLGLCPKATKRMKVPAAKSASKLARKN